MKKFNIITLFAVLYFSMHTLQLNAQQVGAEAPNFTLQGIDGNSYTLSELRGKVVYIFLFGAECSFCRQSAPVTQRDIVNRFRDNENFVAIGIDTWNRSAASVINFRNQTGLEYPLLQQGGNVATAYGSTHDRNLVINSEGILAYKGNAAARTDIAAVISSIEQSLSTLTSVEGDLENLLPNAASLGQNYPNPFNPSTQIPFSLTTSATVSITIYSILGEKVAEITNQTYTAGSYTVSWNGSSTNGQAASTGMYLYRMLINGELVEVRKMTMLR